MFANTPGIASVNLSFKFFQVGHLPPARDPLPPPPGSIIHNS